MENKQKKCIRSQGRQMIARVYHFLKAEFESTLISYQEPNFDLSHLRNIAKRTAEATGVGERTVHRVLKEERDSKKGTIELSPLPPARPKKRKSKTNLTSNTTSSKCLLPLKTRRKQDYKVDIDGFTADVVRSTIQEFHVVHKQIPTLSTLLAVLNKKDDFDKSTATLRVLLNKLGYQWRRTDSNRKVLVERHDIQMWRLQYLKNITEYRSQGRPIVFIDESNVFTSHVENNSGARRKKQSPMFSNVSAGTSFVLVHAGTDAGFINNACLVYKDNSVAENYHQIYVKWLNETLLPNLPDRSVIVLDSTSYHNERAERLPTLTSKKSEMQQWLTYKGIQFNSNLRKVELYDIIKKHKSNLISHKIDELIKSKGFEVLRLPPCHPELNAMKSIWGALKNYIALRNVELNVDNTETIIHESIEKMSTETWRNTCDRVIKKEAEYMKYLDTEFEFTVLQDEADTDTENESDTDDDSEDFT